MKCEHCGDEIPEARLEALPGVKSCVKCAAKHPVKINYDPEIVMAHSATGRNGFAPND